MVIRYDSNHRLRYNNGDTKHFVLGNNPVHLCPITLIALVCINSAVFLSVHGSVSVYLNGVFPDCCGVLL